MIPDDPTGIHPSIPEAEYHGHKDSLSVSGAKVLLKAPALFRWQQDHPVHKDVFDVGSAAHALVLGVGDPIAVIDADSWRSKAAQEARDAARAKGETPLLAADYQRVQDMADALASHTLAMELLSDGQPEVSAFGVHAASGIMRRGRFDFLTPTQIVDYKTSATVDPADLDRIVENFGYGMQAAWYLVLAANLGHPAERFRFIFQAKEAPYLVTVATPDDLVLEAGWARCEKALHIYAKCVETGRWPGYLDDTAEHTITRPRWAQREA